MGPRVLDVVMTDQDYEALRKKLLETYSVQPTLQNPTKKRLVDWHCLESPCFLDNTVTVFDKREKWIRHHQRFHNRMCESDRGYPKEMEAKQFIQEHERRENSRLGIFPGAGGSAGLLPPPATPAGPYPRISGAVRAIPLNFAAPSSSTSGALRGASPNSAAPNSPRSGALRNSAAARRRGPYRVRANKAARPQEHRHQAFVNIAGSRQDEPESSGTLDAAQREILMQQLSYNLQAVSRITANSVHIMQILGLPSTNCMSEIRRPAGRTRPRESPNTRARGHPATTVATPVPLPTWVDWRALASTSRRATGLQAGQSKFVDAASQVPAHSNVGPAHAFEVPRHVSDGTPYPSQAPAHFNEGPAHVFEATPYPSQALANSDEAPAHRSRHPSQALALSLGGPAHSCEGRPPLSIEHRPAHPYEAPELSIAGPAHPALTYMTRSHPEENEEEENHNAASDTEGVDSDSDSDYDDEYIHQAVDVSQDVNEGQVEWTGVKVEY